MQKLFSGILILMLSSATLFSQVSLSGKIMNNEHPLRSASVVLLRSDSSIVKGVESNINGEFIFENVTAGIYFVTSSFIGYTTYSSDSIIVNADNIILKNIMLLEESAELNAVVVKAKKQMLEQKMDRLVINVQNSINSSGSTILEVLKKSPGITIDNQNNTISMNGKSGVQVMMNGKMMQVPLEVVLQMLDGMPSSNVDKIELITTPPAKYGAEGNAGVIHIITKTNNESGTSGSIGLTYGYRWARTLGGNFNISHRNKNLVYFLDYSITSNHNRHTLDFTRQTVHNGFSRIITDRGERPNTTNQQNLSAGLEWTTGKNSSIDLGVTGYRRNWEMNAVTRENDHMSRDSNLITDISIHETNIWQGSTVSLGYHKKLNAKHEININTDYLYFNNDNPSQYSNEVLHGQVNETAISKIDLEKKTPIKVFVARIDHQYIHSPLFSLEAGIKGVTSRLDNNVTVRNLVDEQLMIDSFFTSSSALHEQTGAAYISSKWKPATRWEINMGLRYEYTHTNISSSGQKNLVNRKYGYLFPTFILKKDLDKEKDLTFSYARRITRPTYNDIAPYVFFWGPNSFSSGNTSLKSALSDAAKVAFRIKQWVLSFQYSHVRDEIIPWQAEADSLSDNITFRSQNLRFLDTYGITSSYTFNITMWWKVQSSVTAQYQVAQSTHLTFNPRIMLNSINANLINSFTLPKDYSIEISGIYQSKSLTGVANFLARGSLNAGIQKKTRNGTFRFAMDDILNTDLWKIRTYSPGNNLNTQFNYNFHNQYARFTYTRNIGNNKLRSVKIKSGADEERERLQ